MRSKPRFRTIWTFISSWTITQPTRRNWLAKRPRWHVHLTPTSSSWLNLVECFFALITERKIRRGTAVRPHYAPKITSFIEHHNAHQSRSDGQNQPTTSSVQSNASVPIFCQPRLKMSRTFGSGHSLDLDFRFLPPRRICLSEWFIVCTQSPGATAKLQFELSMTLTSARASLSSTSSVK